MILLLHAAPLVIGDHDVTEAPFVEEGIALDAVVDLAAELNAIDTRFSNPDAVLTAAERDHLRVALPMIPTLLPLLVGAPGRKGPLRDLEAELLDGVVTAVAIDPDLAVAGAGAVETLTLALTAEDQRAGHPGFDAGTYWSEARSVLHVDGTLADRRAGAATWKARARAQEIFDGASPTDALLRASTDATAWLGLAATSADDADDRLDAGLEAVLITRATAGRLSEEASESEAARSTAWALAQRAIERGEALLAGSAGTTVERRTTIVEAYAMSILDAEQLRDTLLAADPALAPALAWRDHDLVRVQAAEEALDGHTVATAPTWWSLRLLGLRMRDQLAPWTPARVRAEDLLALRDAPADERVRGAVCDYVDGVTGVPDEVRRAVWDSATCGGLAAR